MLCGWYAFDWKHSCLSWVFKRKFFVIYVLCGWYAFDWKHSCLSWVFKRKSWLWLLWTFWLVIIWILQRVIGQRNNHLIESLTYFTVNVCYVTVTVDCSLPNIPTIDLDKTRKHSSRMRTARLPTISHGILGSISKGGRGYLSSLDITTLPWTFPYPIPRHTNCPRHTHPFGHATPWNIPTPWTFPPQKGPVTRDTHFWERTRDRRYPPL